MNRHFLNCCVFPPRPVTAPHNPTRQALEGAPSEQLLQQSQVPQYYAPQPWVPLTSSLSPSCLAFPSSHQLLSSSSCFISIYSETAPSVRAQENCTVSEK